MTERILDHHNYSALLKFPCSRWSSFWSSSRSYVAALCLILLACERAATEPPSAGGTIPSLGTNLDAFGNWTSAQPFLDVFKTVAGFRAPASWVARGYVSDVDADGWVKSLPAEKESWEGLQFEALLSPAAPPHRRYVVDYKGEGSIQAWGDTRVISSSQGRLLIASGAKGDVRLTLTATDPKKTGNYVRNISIVEEKYLPLFEAGLSFNPEWMARIQDFHTLRFMDWTVTNQIFDNSGKEVTSDHANASLIDWTSRPQVTDAVWNRGAPVEVLVELSNRTGTDMWVNVPVNASDDYIRGFATYVRDHLRSDLKVHVELSNEIWNSAFVQNHYAQARAKIRFGNASGFGEWNGMRTAQMGQIWNEVFRESAKGGDPGRALIVFATQSAWHGLEETGLETPNWRGPGGRHVRAADYFDEYAISGYYNGTSGSKNPEAQLLEWSRGPDGVDKALAAIGTEIDSLVAKNYTYHGSIAAKYDLRMVVYEGGPHINTPFSLHGNTELTDWLIELNRHPEFYRFDQRNYATFRKAGGTLFLNYGIIATPSKFGSWGALERTDQRRSPRYDALMDYSNSHNPWWESGRERATFRNSKSYIAGDAGESIVGTARGYDILIGGAGNDTFRSLGTNVTIDGRGGIDTLQLEGAASQYRPGPVSAGFQELRRGRASIRFRNIEKTTYSSAE